MKIVSCCPAVCSKCLNVLNFLLFFLSTYEKMTFGKSHFVNSDLFHRFRLYTIYLYLIYFKICENFKVCWEKLTIFQKFFFRMLFPIRIFLPIWMLSPFDISYRIFHFPPILTRYMCTYAYTALRDAYRKVFLFISHIHFVNYWKSIRARKFAKFQLIKTLFIELLSTSFQIIVFAVD